MSGHSKWSKVKHQKATTDVAKAAAFTKASRAIIVAVCEGGGITDPDDNFRLRLAVGKAREVNMPKENIERAIAKGKGVGASVIEAVTYEGYGPGGVAVIIEGATDNKNRTVSAIKHAFECCEGSMGGPGTVSFLFERVGVMTLEKRNRTLDEALTLAIEENARDVLEKDDVFEVFTDPTILYKVQKAFELAGFIVDNAEIVLLSKSMVSVPQDKQKSFGLLIETLESMDDVQRVYTNKNES